MNHSTSTDDKTNLEENPTQQDFEADSPDVELEDSPESSEKSPWQKKRNWLILLGLVVLLGVGYGGWRWWQSRSGGEKTEQQQGQQGTPVELAGVETMTVEDSSEFAGNLEAEQAVDIQSEREGRVEAILVQQGERVSAETPLVQLGSTQELADTQSALAQVDVARAAIESNRAEISALEAERSRAQAEVELQQEEIRRISTLVAEGALADRELDRQERDRAVAQADLNTVNRRIQAAEARLSQAQANLRSRQAEVQSLQENLQDTTVSAPFAGTISDIPIEVGDYVNRGQMLSRLIANQTLELNLNIPQERSSELQEGLPVRIIDAEGNALQMGRISFIAPEVDTNSQFIQTEAVFPNPNRQFRDGQFVRVQAIWEQRPNRVVVPQTAVVYRGDQRFVYVPQQQEGQLVAKRQPIELGLEQGTKVEVIEGLNPDDRIVVSGLQTLGDGAPIRPQEQ
jgi:RND family efflux transporter MFP subunit